MADKLMHIPNEDTSEDQSQWMERLNTRPNKQRCGAGAGSRQITPSKISA